MAQMLFPSIIPESDSDDDPTAVLESGDCPWCDSYSGDSPRQHAAAAHPDAYDALEA